jgi:hypothetical protein
MKSATDRNSRIAFRFLVVGAIFMGTIVQTNVGQASIGIDPSVTELGLFFRENFEIGSMPTAFIAHSNPTDEKSRLICTDIDDKNCTDASHISGGSNWDICNENSKVACVAEFWAVDPKGQKTFGEFVKSLPRDPRYVMSENVAANLPQSNGVGAVWKVPGVLNSAQKESYFVGVRSETGVNKIPGEKGSSYKFDLSSLVVAIIPVEEVFGSFPLLTISKSDVTGEIGSNESSSRDGQKCAVSDVNMCASIKQFPEGYRFGVTIRVGEKLKGWYHGRLSFPQIITKDWKTGQQISIEAEPVKISSLDFVVPNAQIPQKIREFIAGKRLGRKGDGVSRTQIVERLASTNALEILPAFTDSFNDKATSTDSYWSFKTLSNENLGEIGKCSDNSGSLAGLVTTNSLTYSDGPPSFDKESGSLTYKVASPHFDANGAVARGSYDLVIRADVARCIYGFSKAPIRAEVSITSSDGSTQEIASELLSEKDGWFSLSAKNFTYSAPTLKVKLTQEKPQEVVVEKKPEADKPVEQVAATVKLATAKKSISITCAKGKINKKITGVNPKCPSGYRKK